MVDDLALILLNRLKVRYTGRKIGLQRHTEITRGGGGGGGGGRKKERDRVRKRQTGRERNKER